MVNNELLKLGELAMREDGTYTPLSGDAWMYALEMTLLGMGMIFAVLAVLWCVLAIFKLIFARSKTQVKAEETPRVTDAPKVEASVVSAPAEATDDAELVAVLTAAIVAYEAENNPESTPANFRVVSFRRTSGGRSWNAK